MKKKSSCYFEGFVKGMEFACSAAAYLKDIIAGFDGALSEDKLNEMHKIEHEADILKHSLMEKLSAEFITPIEREDIILMLLQIDDVTDSIEDVVRKMYMYNVQGVRPEALQFARIIEDCTDAVRYALTEMPEFRKSSTLQGLIIKVNEYEEEGDRLHLKAVRGLYTNADVSADDKLVWTQMFELMENCCDKCEDVADSIETVIQKNS